MVSSRQVAFLLLCTTHLLAATESWKNGVESKAVFRGDEGAGIRVRIAVPVPVIYLDLPGGSPSERGPRPSTLSLV